MEDKQFESYLAEEVKRIRGIYYPTKAGFLRQTFVKAVPCNQLHPNPNDEFCFPEIGPNYGLISSYTKDYQKAGNDLAQLPYLDSAAAEPIFVEKTRPDGYMILNGHHRWAAALRVGMKKIPVKIVDLTQKNDIRKMLHATTSHRRVTLDLDEVIFRSADHPFLERQLPFPLQRFYQERLRLGIPALFNMMNRQGYDIWIYTAQYYSLEYLQRYFKHYHAYVTGIVTGTARKGPEGTDTRAELEKLCSSKYESTVHVDNETVILTRHGIQDYEEYPLSNDSEHWSRNVMDVFDRIKAP